jgi:hypothetical protein
MEQRKQQQMRLKTWRRMHEYLISLDLIGEAVPSKQDFVSDAVDEKIDRAEAKAQRQPREK